MSALAPPILRRGRNCWRIEPADRVALIVDAADYFAAAKAAIARARHAVMLIGWQFDLRIQLEPDREPPPPDQLGAFLKACAAERPQLRIYSLRWDGAVVAARARQILTFLARRLAGRRSGHGSLPGGGGASRSPVPRYQRSRANSPSARAAAPSTAKVAS